MLSRTPKILYRKLEISTISTISTIGLPIWLQQMLTDPGIIKIAYKCMNIENWEQGRVVLLLGLHNSNLLCSVHLCTSIYSLTVAQLCKKSMMIQKFLTQACRPQSLLGRSSTGSTWGSPSSLSTICWTSSPLPIS
jgi:hypothetical protein